LSRSAVSWSVFAWSVMRREPTDGMVYRPFFGSAA
jgi:hypothetical protein